MPSIAIALAATAKRRKPLKACGARTIRRLFSAAGTWDAGLLQAAQACALFIPRRETLDGATKARESLGWTRAWRMGGKHDVAITVPGRWREAAEARSGPAARASERVAEARTIANRLCVVAMCRVAGFATCAIEARSSTMRLSGC